MDERLYRQMVAVIRRFSFQIIVADADGYHEFTNMNGDAGDTVLVRCLTLQACYAYGNYPRGHKPGGTSGISRSVTFTRLSATGRRGIPSSCGVPGVAT